MSSPAKILIIEDDPALLRGLQDNFRAEGYVVRVAINGQIGLDEVLADPPDLILLDIMLPIINGFELCRLIRAEKLEMPIIMLTARGQEADIIRGLELGADDYVTKPFGIRELLARVKAFLRRRLRPQTVLGFGPFRLDGQARKFFRGGREVVLTSKEFKLLEFFLQRPGRALTRDQILDGVWGRAIMVNDRSVDRCITTLRAKIEPDPHEPIYVRTIRDIGYRFEMPGGFTGEQTRTPR